MTYLVLKSPLPFRCFRLAAFAVMAVGCFHSPPPPSQAYSGSDALVVSNANPDPLCYLYIAEASSRTWGDNWLASQGLLGIKLQRIESNASAEWKVRPGKYKVRALGCEVTDSAMNRRGDGNGSIESLETQPYPAFANQGAAFEVAGATQIMVHPATAPAGKVRDGYTLADAPVKYARRLNAQDLYKLAGGDCTQQCRDGWNLCLQENPKAGDKCSREQDRCEAGCR